MTVDELRKAIARLPGHLRVEITLPTDEFQAVCVTADRHYLRICQKADDISSGETILHNDEVEA